MKHKVSELEGVLLDAAVAKAEDCYHFGIIDPPSVPARRIVGDHGITHEPFRPSEDWNDAGPIIERERIEILFYGSWGGERGPWEAQIGVESHYIDQGVGEAMGGQTPLIAAMRAYVASKFGEEVELP